MSDNEIQYTIDNNILDKTHENMTDNLSYSCRCMVYAAILDPLFSIHRMQMSLVLRTIYEAGHE